MLKRLNKIANSAFQLNKIAFSKKAGLAAPLAASGANVAKKMHVGFPVMGTSLAGLGAVSTVSKAKQVAKDEFNPAKRDLMLGTTQPG